MDAVEILGILPLWLLIAIALFTLGGTWLLIYQEKRFDPPAIPVWLCYLGLGGIGISFAHVGVNIFHHFTEPVELQYWISLIIWFAFSVSTFVALDESDAAITNPAL